MEKSNKASLLLLDLRNIFANQTQKTFACSNSTIKTLKKGVKCVKDVKK